MCVCRRKILCSKWCVMGTVCVCVWWMWQVRALGEDSTLHQKTNQTVGDLIVPQSSWLGKTEERERASSVPAGNKSAIYQHPETLVCIRQSLSIHNSYFSSLCRGALRSSCLGPCLLCRHYLLSVVYSSMFLPQGQFCLRVHFSMMLPLTGVLMYYSSSSITPLVWFLHVLKTEW